MPRAFSKRSTWIATGAVWAVAAGLVSAPGSVNRAVRRTMLDLIVSGQAMVIVRCEAVHWRASEPSAPVDDPSQTAFRTEKASLERDCRRLRLENARLRDELKLAEKYGVSPIRVRRVGPDEARVAIVAIVIRGKHLSRGGKQGIADSATVVDEVAPRVDQGREGGIEPELDVFVGRCVVGRIASAGRWTSTLELVTDAHYRALAQILRPTEQGGTFGAEGIFVGQGTALCKLNDVPTTQTVRVGDEVFTSDRDGRTGVPLYYGRVVRVAEAGRHWDITVEPAVKFDELKTVAVLKLPPRTGRLLAE